MSKRTTRPVKVVHISSAHPANDNRVHLREAASLAAAGYDVTLVAVEVPMSIPETGVALDLLPARTRVKRIVGGSIDAVRRAVHAKAEIVHMHDPELIWSIPVLRAMGRTVIYDAHEDLPAQVMGKHYLPMWARHFFALVSRGLLKVAGTASLVIAATDKIAERFPEDRTVVVKNYPRLRADEPQDDVIARPRAWAYVGAMSSERGCIPMIASLAEGSGTWRAAIAGAPSPVSFLDQMRSTPGWDKVDFHGQVSPDTARDLLNTCQAGMVVLERNEAFLDSLPTKMFEYFAAGIPVVASDFPLWRSIIEHYDCGVLVDETDPVDIARGLDELARSPERLAELSANARTAAQELNWDAEERRLVEAYDRLNAR